MVRIIWAGLLVLLTIIGLLLVGTIIFLENRNPEKTVAWLIILAVFPIIGFVMYLVLGRNARKRKLFKHKYLNAGHLKRIVGKQEQRLTEQDVVLGDGADQKMRLVRLLLNNAVSPLTSNNRVEVLTNGFDKFAALFEALESAQEHIHLEYYIFKNDEIGRDTMEILTRKSRAGVEVRVIVDGLGSRSLPPEFMQEMREAGVQIQMFFPVRFPFLSSKLNFRNHRKIVIVDGRVGFLGGMNIGDEYLSRDKVLGFWRDTHLKVEGDCVHMLQTTFLNDWYFITREQVTDGKYYPQSALLEKRLTQIVASGPDSDWESIRQVFFTALATAQRKVYVETPYFVPDESITMALKTAALSGLDVRLIVQGVPEYKLTYWASRSYFDELLKAGVKVYKYQKGILHAKVALIDDVVAIVGSANIDIRSFQLNFEISALLYNRETVARLERDFQQDLVNSSEVQFEVYDKRPLSDRFKESGARLLSPLL
ncbi:MAG: cardiolipin synthase [Tumebacillaceae bacterium]